MSGLWCMRGPQIRLWIMEPAFVIHNVRNEPFEIRNAGRGIRGFLINNWKGYLGAE